MILRGTAMATDIERKPRASGDDPVARALTPDADT